ncbi:class I SAM-dependent methyltransferase [Synechococcus sp. CC9902]|uniref:class I SAM-dependent methyltransferase n=1 Tax=Synechococcus sp. (strain CC9902) TaxID=316279 RepID=UPI00059E9CAE|nr:class I SAM-dependent methyltransferase [Synechococcus sp. CC9902]
MAYKVPDSAPIEHKAICDLANKGLSPQELFRAAYTFYRLALEEEAANDGRSIVESGLFRGMSLYPQALASQVMPKIQGTYEKEVQDFLIEHSEAFERFLDVGCAEGFYLSGIASWKGIPCYGIDIDPVSEKAVEYVAAANKLENLISFSSSLSSAEDFISGKLLCLVDVDGSEFDVLGSLNLAFDQSSSLESVLLLVESDDQQLGRQNTPELISGLVRSGWSIESMIKQKPSNRFVDSRSELSFLEQVVIGAEGRPGRQCWIAASKQFR